MHDNHQLPQMSAKWIPSQLTIKLKERRVDVCEELLERYEAEGNAFLKDCDEIKLRCTVLKAKLRSQVKNRDTPLHQNKKKYHTALCRKGNAEARRIILVDSIANG